MGKADYNKRKGRLKIEAQSGNCAAFQTALLPELEDIE